MDIPNWNNSISAAIENYYVWYVVKRTTSKRNVDYIEVPSGICEDIGHKLGMFRVRNSDEKRTFTLVVDKNQNCLFIFHKNITFVVS